MSFLFFLYSKYAQFYSKYLKSNLISIFILFTMIDNLWNVEGKVSTYFSWFFSSIITIFIVLLLEERKIITIYKKSDILDNVDC